MENQKKNMRWHRMLSIKNKTIFLVEKIKKKGIFILFCGGNGLEIIYVRWYKTVRRLNYTAKKCQLTRKCIKVGSK